MASAKAFLKANNKGVLETHFIVETEKELARYIAKGQVIEKPNGWFKVTTGKPVWLLYKEEEK